MTDNIKLQVEVSPTDASVPLGVEIWLDSNKFYDTDWVRESAEITHEFPDSDSEHEIKFVLKNKLPDHTICDDQGNIVKDALIEIKNLKLDDIELGELFYSKSQYTHNFNGNGADTTEPYMGSMGCNGTVSFKFSSPVYLWLLENM